MRTLIPSTIHFEVQTQIVNLNVFTQIISVSHSEENYGKVTLHFLCEPVCVLSGQPKSLMNKRTDCIYGA